MLNKLYGTCVNPPPKSVWMAFFYNLNVFDKDACWVWTKTRFPNEYGNFRYKEHNLLAHRVIYGWLFGGIEEDLVIDHFYCDNPPCVNPYHLRACTQWENLKRSDCASAKFARREFCENGHDQSNPFNRIKFNSDRGARCRICHNARVRRYRAIKNA
jgi:HNH endonuclease